MDAGKRINSFISTEDEDYIIRIIKSLESSGVLIDRVSETVKNETEKQEGGFLGILLGTSGASMLGNNMDKKV